MFCLQYGGAGPDSEAEHQLLFHSSPYIPTALRVLDLFVEGAKELGLIAKAMTNPDISCLIQIERYKSHNVKSISDFIIYRCLNIILKCAEYSYINMSPRTSAFLSKYSRSDKLTRVIFLDKQCRICNHSCYCDQTPCKFPELYLCICFIPMSVALYSIGHLLLLQYSPNQTVVYKAGPKLA